MASLTATLIVALAASAGASDCFDHDQAPCSKLVGDKDFALAGTCAACLLQEATKATALTNHHATTLPPSPTTPPFRDMIKDIPTNCRTGRRQDA